MRFTHPGSFKDKHSGLVHFPMACGPAFCDSVSQCKESCYSNAAYLVPVARSSKGGRYRQDLGLKSTFRPLAQAQFGKALVPDFSPPLLLTTAFDDEDDDDDEYEMPSAKRVVRMQGREPRSPPERN